MHRAFTAGGLVFLERAMMQTLPGIGKDLLTVIAEYLLGTVVISAKTPDHHFHGPGFPLHAF
jgi:hypothetical protein